MEDFIRLLKTPSEARGPSGFEDEVRGMVIREMEPYVDEVVVDRWGNVIGVRRGSSDYRAMAAAHMDEIGLIVDYIDKEGFLRIRPIGGWSEVTLAGQRVWVRAADGRWVRGVVGVTPPLDVRDEVDAATLLRHVIEKTPPPVIDKFLERRVK
jgi:Cellulase M and related proteins